MNDLHCNFAIRSNQAVKESVCEMSGTSTRTWWRVVRYEAVIGLADDGSMGNGSFWIESFFDSLNSISSSLQSHEEMLIEDE